MIRIMLVDDQRFARLGFQLMLDDASDIVVTAQSADGRSAIETLEQLAVQHRPLPNVILMDVRMPGMDGIEATRRITRRWPTISILILTTYDEDDYAFGGLDAGASGFLLKDVTKHNLIDAVHAIANGDAILTPRITRQVLERGVPHPTSSQRQQEMRKAFDALTPRQREICALISEGAHQRGNRQSTHRRTCLRQTCRDPYPRNFGPAQSHSNRHRLVQSRHVDLLFAQQLIQADCCYECDYRTPSQDGFHVRHPIRQGGLGGF